MKKQIVDNIVRLLDENVKGLYVVGSYRRNEDIINDLDFVTKRDLNDVLRDINRIMNFDSLVIGPDYVRIRLYYTHQYSISVDIWKANNMYEYKFLKWMRTMDKEHNIGYRLMAKNKGLLLSDRGLYDREIDHYYTFDTLENLIKFLKQ